MPSIAAVLEEAHQQLLSLSNTPLLDAEVLLSDALHVTRSHLFAFPERELTQDELQAFQKRLVKRQQKIPIAYITGHKEFWSLDLLVTPDTLIPRPETELLVECVLEQIKGAKKKVADLGCGSGAIALAIASMRPDWEIHATDVSRAALKVAQLNAERLQLSHVIFHQGSWFEAFSLGEKFDVIVSNPPYIALNDPNLETDSVRYEPQSALIADENGLKDLRHIIMQAKHYLHPNGKLLLEHGFLQAKDVRSIFANMGYSDVNTYQDLAGLDRVTGGRI